TQLAAAVAVAQGLELPVLDLEPPPAIALSNQLDCCSIAVGADEAVADRDQRPDRLECPLRANATAEILLELLNLDHAHLLVPFAPRRTTWPARESVATRPS